MQYAILGGGIAGLATGDYLRTAGVKFKVFEKESNPGGLSESYMWNGFYCDFAAHRFFTQNENIKRAVMAKVPMIHHTRRSKLFVRGHWLSDPINPLELMKIIPFKERLYLLRDLICAGKEVDTFNFEDYIIGKYGKYMFDVFFKPYTEKLFRIHSKEISVLWAKKKSRLINPFKKANTSSKKYFSHFYYPLEGGYGAIPQAYYRDIADKVELNARVVTVLRNEKVVEGIEYIQNGEKKIFECNGVISTLPLTITGSLFDLDVSLSYGSLAAVYLLLVKPKASNNHWVYFVDENICVNRMVEFKQMSAYNTPDDSTVLCAEVTKELSDPINEVISDLSSIGFLETHDVKDAWVAKNDFAYPTYRVGYEKVVKQAIDEIESYKNVYVVGRAAEFMHREVDDVIEASKNLAERIAGHSISHPRNTNMKSDKKKVCIVVLTYNNYSDTDECLKSLRNLAGGPFPTIIVDNNSKDNTVERLKIDYPEVELITLKRNQGVTGGVNQGVFRALSNGFDYVLLLNNDTLADIDMMQEMLAVAEHDENCAMVMPRIYYYPPREGQYTQKDIWSDGGFLRKVPLSIKLKDNRRSVNHDEPRKIEYAPSCALLIKRKTFERVGLFDHNYFLFYEDWDFSVRIRDQALNIWIAPKALLWHKVSSTTKKDMTVYWDRFGESAAIFFRRHHKVIPSIFHIGYFALRDFILKPSNLKYLKSFLKGLARGLKVRLDVYPDLASFSK